jgi:universal stress protein E
MENKYKKVESYMSENSFLVVIDPSRSAQPALERAIQTARLTGGKLHLFECVNESYNGTMTGSPEVVKKAVLKEFEQQLEPLVDRVRLLGIEASYELVWADDWRQAVVDASKRNNSYMVFKSSYVHSPVHRARNKTSDWSLLRECCCPVLLMHHNSKWENRRILAAVNIASEDENHIQLNRKVIDVATQFASSYGADVYYVNAISPVAASEKAAVDDDMFFAFDDVVEVKQPVKVTADSVASYCGVDAERCFVLPGPTDQVILKQASEIGVDLIIIGSVRRSGIKARIIGNTAEKLLDRTSADILTLS